MTVTRLPRSTRLAIAGPAGALETLVEEPEGHGRSSFGVVCHPHPLHGGTLDNKVVYTLARALHDMEIPTIRFNFRGVGTSEGRFDDGSGETQDALAVVNWGRARWPAAHPWLLGFSFGAAVASKAAVQAQARRLVTVAPAIDRIATGYPMPSCPWLLIQGDADEVIDAGAVLEWAARQAPAPTVRVFKETGHFFHGRLAELRAAVVEFASY